MQEGLFLEFEHTRSRVPVWARRILPSPIRGWLSSLFWKRNDLRDFIAEAIGWLPSHTIRLFLYRRLIGLQVGFNSSIHRNCRIYFPAGISLGDHTIINRDVLLDGRSGLSVGSNVSISEGTAIFSLEHDPNSPSFANRGAPVFIEDYVFIGGRAIILPGITISQGAVVAAGAVVTRDVAPFTIVAGVPARSIGERTKNLSYQLNYRKFLG